MSDTRIGGGGTARISVFDIATPRNGGFELALAAQIPAAVLPNVRTPFRQSHGCQRRTIYHGQRDHDDDPVAAQCPSSTAHDTVLLLTSWRETAAPLVRRIDIGERDIDALDLRVMFQRRAAILPPQARLLVAAEG